MVIYILFVIGFVVLIKGADLLVDGASSLASRFGVSALVIGLTIVSFGTSAPELVVNIMASLNGNTDIAIGNILGSNIANILLILGIAALIYPLAVQRSTVWKEIPFALLAVVVFALMVGDSLIDGAATSILTRTDGLILLSFFVIFLYYIFGLSKSSANKEEVQDEEPPQYSWSRSLAMVGFGMVGLVLGGTWIVDGAVFIATKFGLSEALIGLTIIAIGTSLPELATSAVAAYKRNVDIAIGNVVGSNIFNIFWILGVSAIIHPLPFAEILISDVAVAVLATLGLFIALFLGNRHTLDRWQGGVFVVIYIAYLVFLVFRG